MRLLQLVVLLALSLVPRQSWYVRRRALIPLPNQHHLLGVLRPGAARAGVVPRYCAQVPQLLLRSRGIGISLAQMPRPSQRFLKRMMLKWE